MQSNSQEQLLFKVCYVAGEAGAGLGEGE